MMETLILDIGGMSCGGCVKSVTRILEGVKAWQASKSALKTKVRPSDTTPRKPMQGR